MPDDIWFDDFDGSGLNRLENVRIENIGLVLVAYDNRPCTSGSVRTKHAHPK